MGLPTIAVAGGTNSTAMARLRNYLELEHKDKKKTPLDTSDWTIVQPGVCSTPRLPALCALPCRVLAWVLGARERERY